jgi:hypothetical protein
MCLTEEQCNAIEEFAYQLLPPGSIAIALECDPDDFLDEINRRGSDAHKAYWRGYLRQMGEIHADMIKAAKNGSNPAQMELVKYINNIRREIKHG